MASRGSLKLARSSLFATLRLHGPDQNGVMAAHSQLLDKNECGIMKSEQFIDQDLHHLYLRSLFQPTRPNTSCKSDGIEMGFHVEQKLAIEDEMDNLKERFGLNMSKINWRERTKRMAVFVSKSSHCLWEILLRHEAKELDCDISVIISNHAKLRPIAETFGIPFKVYPISPENKFQQEREEISMLKDELGVDVIVLARYMQVISNKFLKSFEHDQMINIHHSFLPAFVGPRPYSRAYDRGVKLVGATAHYVTQELDDGPIIDQDVIRVTHRDGTSALVRKGRIIERNVLVNAIQAHLEDRIIAHNNKCVVFNE